MLLLSPYSLHEGWPDLTSGGCGRTTLRLVDSLRADADLDLDLAKQILSKTKPERVPPLQISQGGHQKMAASSPTLRAGFLSFGEVELARA